MPDPVKISIQRSGQSPHEFDLVPGTYSVGSDKENQIVLPDRSVSWKHATLSVTDKGIFIEDLNSSNGTYIDGSRVSERTQVRPGQPVQLGYYVVTIGPPKAPTTPAPESTPAPPDPAAASEESGSDSPPEPPPPPPPKKSHPALAPAKPISPEMKRRREIKKQIHEELLERLDLKRMTATQAGEAQLQQRTRDVLTEIIDDVKERLPKAFSPQDLLKEIYDEAVGLGPLEVLLEDPSVTEVMVNGHAQVYVEQAGRLKLTQHTFVDNESVMAVIERIVAPIGRRIDESQPYVDARLPDGSRVNAIIHPLSLVGPVITIRKFSKEPLTVQDLVDFGSFTWDIAGFIDCCVKCKKNIIVSGGTGTGKTTVLNVVSSYLPDDERIITIEDAAELRLTQLHVVRLEARPPNIEGRGAISIRDLVRNALRMRPDRIVVGEVRGPEALDMLQAMNTGHEGSLTTVHANSPRDVISRLETMVLMGGMELPLKAIREQVGSAIQMIIHLSRFSDGTRKVSKISEISGMEGDKLTMQDLFEFKQTGVDDNGKVLGRLMPTGAVPTFLDEFRLRGLELDNSVFDPNRVGANT